MNKQTFKWLLSLVCVLLSASLACGSGDFVPWTREEDDDETTVCDDGLIIDYAIFCDEKSSPRVHNFSGKVFNNSDTYAHNVMFKAEFPTTPPEPSCSFQFDEIAPGATVEALCQFTAPECNYKAYFVDDTCEFLSYTEHLDWMTNQDNENLQEPEAEEEPQVDDEMSIEELTQLFVPVLDDLEAEWVNKVKGHPCQPDQAEAAFQSYTFEKAKALSDANSQLVGEGKPWESIETLRDWLVTESDRDENEKVTKTWKGDFDITNKILDRCYACTPPTLIGTISLTVDLKTCAVEGNVSAAGEGDTTVNDCIDGQPISATCTAHGKMDFSGKITGKADKDGILTLDQTIVSTDFSSGWVEGCDWASHEVENYHWDDPVEITGSIDWNDAASGTFKYASNVCSIEGDWSVNSD